MHMQTFQPQKPSPYTCGVSQMSALDPSYLQHISKACADETPPAPKVSTCFECPWQPQCVPPGPRNLAQLTCTDLTSPKSHGFHHLTSLSQRQTKASPAPKVSTRPWVPTAEPQSAPLKPSPGAYEAPPAPQACSSAKKQSHLPQRSELAPGCPQQPRSAPLEPP